MSDEERKLSKFMQSMMSSEGIGSHDESIMSNQEKNSDDDVWKCFSYMFKINGIEFLFVMSILLTFVDIVLLRYNKMGNESLLVFILQSIFIFIVYLLFDGYIFSFMKSLTHTQKAYILPEFKLGEALGYSFKGLFALAFGIVVFALPGMLVALVSVVLPILKIAGIALLFVLACVFIYYFPGLFWIYVNTKKITSFVQYERLFTMIKVDNGRYMDAVGAFVVLMVVTLVVGYFITNPYFIHITGNAVVFNLMINNLLPILIMSMICTYFRFALIFIISKCINTTELQKWDN